MGKVIDLTGQKFGRLLVEKRGQSPTGRREAYWDCICDCGEKSTVSGYHLRKGKIQSCGCLQKEIAVQLCKDKAIDYKNQKIGKLQVIEKINDKWKCKCDCGKETFVTSRYLHESKNCSCGCGIVYEKKGSVYNLINQRFGKLTVLEETSLRKKEIVIWKCKCECGEEVLVSTTQLLSGKKKSCGCLQSFGEFLIKKILQENNISFVQQKTFEDCLLPSGNMAKFDFYLKDYNCIIEYDGIQHFQATGGWNTEERFKHQKISDKIKNNYCQNNNINIIRIPYTKKDISLLDLMPNTSNFLLQGE